ncbi:protocadherin beta-15-like [Aplochiton taeniatus]
MTLGEQLLSKRVRWLVSLLYLVIFIDVVCGQIRYSIPEEMKKGSLVGNVVQDLGLDLKRLRTGRARIVTGESIQYTELNIDKGILVVNERIDREQLCGDVTPCSFSFEIILENPMELHRVTIEILDINDHAPVFPNKDFQFEISESATVGLRFPIKYAEDSDVGLNALQNYVLTQNPNFILKQLTNPDGSKYAEMILQKPLDREQNPRLSLKLVAVDGGTPQRSGTVNIDVIVLDVNDNAPVFNQSVYKASTGGSLVAEMVPRSADVGYLVTKVVAVDVDSGQNAWLSYKLQKSTERALFDVGLQNGEIRTVRQVTDKDVVKQRLTVVVEDNGQPSHSATVNVNVVVADSFPEVLSEFTDFTNDKETTDSRKSDCQFVSPGSQNVLIMDPSSTGTMRQLQSERHIMDEPDSPIEVRYQ